MEKVRIYNFCPCSEALGPSKRCVVWFQGCPRSCKGCMTLESKDIKSGIETTTDALCNLILSIDGIEGVTISGGDPFMQYDALYDLVKQIKRKSKLGIIAYTGYYMDELRALHKSKIDEILDNYLDILIDGPYVDELNDGCALRGSSNQSVYFLTDRYEKYKPMYDSNKRNIELISKANGNIEIIGVPPKDVLNQLKNI